jgi:hypothetical protein
VRFKVGDKVVCKKDSSSYTGRFAGTDVKIIKLDTNNHCTVEAYDGTIFMCPLGYLEDYDNFYTIPPQPCQCGASKTYGKDCPAYFHYHYCPLYRDKE